MQRLGRAGFTLIEILVSLILLSLLAAAVFPVVTQQIGQADAPRTANDLTSVRSGLELFGVNLRQEFPSDLEDLANALVIGAASDSTLTMEAYSKPDSARWDGPYYDASITSDGVAADADTAFTSGYDAAVLSQLRCYDTTNNARRALGTCENGDFVAVTIAGLDSVAFEQVNDLLDGSGETDGTGAGGSAARGKLRWKTTGDTTFYLAVPYKK